MDKNRGFIYFISDGEFLKIGQTIYLETRLSELQVGNPRKLSVQKTMSFPRHELTKFEKAFHSLFDEYRVSGEWFNNQDYILKYIKTLTNRNIRAMYDRFGKPDNDDARQMWIERGNEISKARKTGRMSEELAIQLANYYFYKQSLKEEGSDNDY